MSAPRTTILCIDDDENALRLRKKVLELSGYRVLCANAPEDGYRLLASEPVQIVILDYFLGKVNGSAVASELHRLAPDVPVLLLSSAVYLPDDARGLVDGFCTKIDGPGVLLDSLKRLLKRRAASQSS